MKSLAILLILGFIGAASTYKCYVCTVGDKNCADPFDGTKMTDQQKVEIPAGGLCVKVKTNDQVVRSIGIPGVCLGGSDGCKKISAAGVSVETCCCQSELCNGVSVVRNQPLLLFISVGVIAFVTRLLL